MGMGNPLLDISSEVGQDMLDKYEVTLDSAILAEPKHLPMYQELVANYSPKFIAGGATQNSIRVAQWLLKNAGYSDESTAFMGCIGTDNFGSKLKECASNDGVLVHYMNNETFPTGTCAVLVKDGERSLIASLGAANHFKPSHLNTHLAKSIYEKSQICYIAGFFLTVSVESLEMVAKHYAETNKIFCLNLSAPFIVDFFTEQLNKALPYADYVFCNETEAEAFGKKYEFGNDLKEVALKLSAMDKINSKRPRSVIFTQGSKSTIVACNGVITEYAVDPLPKELLVDTNGAGDAFVGGFLAQLAQKKSIEDAVDAGHYAARYIIQQSGTTLPSPCTYYNKSS